MKKIKKKMFFIKAALLHVLLITVISIVSLILWENSTYDIMLKNSHSTTIGSEDIAIVVIDEKSLKSHRWPWKRSLYGDIFNYFNNYTSVKAIAFDSVLNTLDEENPQSDKEFFNVVKQTPKLTSGYLFSTDQYNDQVNGKDYNLKFKSKFSLNVNDKRSDSNKYSGYYKSIGMYPEEYFKALRQAGSVNVTRDFDGILRQANDLLSYDNSLYASLPLRTYLYINKSDKVTVTDKYLIVDKTGLKIPINMDYGSIAHLIKYYKFIPGTEYSHKKYSAIDIINSAKAIKEGRKPIIDPAEFKDKVVYVGANAQSNAIGLADVTDTPIAVKHAGVDVQATILDNLMHNSFMVRTSAMQNIGIILLLSILSFIVIRSFSFIISMLILIGIAIAYFVVCMICFNFNLAPLVITPLAAQLSTMIFGYSYRFILEGRNKEKIKQAMGKYLSQDIMQNVVQNIDDIKLGGKKANVTVLFADIRGFTSMSEKMTAEEVSKILNEYFSEIEPIITKYNGVINKFIGDAVMAIFGEPIQDINHPSNAVKCAYEMLKKVEWLQSKWLNEGKPKIEIGIGINTGEAFVGNIGSEKRLEYTVIGDMVNLASRIESYNKVYKTNFLISSSTYSHVSTETDVIKISEVTIRGKAKKMDIYEVLRVNNS